MSETPGKPRQRNNIKPQELSEVERGNPAETEFRITTVKRMKELRRMDAQRRNRNFLVKS